MEPAGTERGRARVQVVPRGRVAIDGEPAPVTRLERHEARPEVATVSLEERDHPARDAVTAGWVTLETDRRTPRQIQAHAERAPHLRKRPHGLTDRCS